jgi:hypothetical protein
MFLEQSDGRDSGRACLHASSRIFQRDTAQCEDWNFFQASFPQGIETGGKCARFLHENLFENWPEDGEIRAFFCGAGNLRPMVTGNANTNPSTCATSNPSISYVSGRNVIRAQMHAVGSAGQSNVCAGVYEDVSSQFIVLCSQSVYEGVGQGLELASGKVFLAQLDVVDAAASGLHNGFQ